MIVCNLDKILKQQLLRRSDLIRMTGLDASKVYRLAQNRVQVVELNTINKICEALEISTDELFVNKQI